MKLNYTQEKYEYWEDFRPWFKSQRSALKSLTENEDSVRHK